ncbi:MAG: hypothetical protein IJ906_08415 [Oscillospiraceae bacterium]|nr:hypothetical protein [Oscillospiraceae bacterium]
MEFVIGAIIIIILLLILGVPWILIVEIIIGLLLLLLVVMFVFFAVTLVLALMSRPVKGKFLRIMIHEVVGTYAIYEIDGKEYKNTFPAEIMFVNKIYHEGQIYPLRLHKGKKRYMLYDWYSWIVIGAGLVLSGGGLLLALWVLRIFVMGMV